MQEEIDRVEDATTAAVAAWNRVAQVQAAKVSSAQKPTQTFSEIKRYSSEISEAFRGAAIAMEGMVRTMIEEANRSKVRNDG